MTELPKRNPKKKTGNNADFSVSINDPHYSAFASSLSPHQRNYIESYVKHKIAEKILPYLGQVSDLVAQNKILSAKVGTLSAQVDRYNNKFVDDRKYEITRPKIVALLKELGI